MRLLKRKSKESPFRLPSKAEFSRFELRKIGGPTWKDFRVQLKGSLACQWNHRAAEVFSGVFVKKNGNKFKQKEIAACFKTHLRTLRNQYERIKGGTTETQAALDERSRNARRVRRQGVSTPHITY